MGGSSRYIDEFISLRTASLLLDLKLFPNGKEITESMAAKAAIRKSMFAKRLADRAIDCFVVGDGHVPRTGALIATTSAWSVTSIDPQMREKDSFKRINRLTCVRAKVEDCPALLLNPSGHKGAVLLYVHSHAPWDLAWNALAACYDEVVGVAIPCCFPMPTSPEEKQTYDDQGCWSVERTVHIWEFNRRR